MKKFCEMGVVRWGGGRAGRKGARGSYQPGKQVEDEREPELGPAAAVVLAEEEGVAVADLAFLP